MCNKIKAVSYIIKLMQIMKLTKTKPKTKSHKLNYTKLNIRVSEVDWTKRKEYVWIFNAKLYIF